MGGSSTKPGKGERGVVAVAEDYHQGVGGTSGIRIFIYFRGPVGADFWRRNLGGHPLHRTVPGGVPGLGGETIDREAPTATDGWKMGIHLGGGKREEAGFKEMEEHIWRK